MAIELPAFLEDFRDILAEMQKSDDRTAAILGAAMLDEALLAALRKRLRPGDVSDGLLRPSGALGAFDARGKLAYALGIMGELTYKDFKILRDIRNHFAHVALVPAPSGRPRSLGFESDRIRGWCGNLGLPEHYGVRPDPVLSPRDRFIWVAVLITAGLWNYIHGHDSGPDPV